MKLPRVPMQLGWYAVGTAFAAAGSAVLLLLYARSLPADELAALVLVQATVTVLRIFGTAGAPLGLLRYMAGPTEDREGLSERVLVTSTLVVVLAGSTLVGTVAAAVAWPVFAALPEQDPRSLMTLAAFTAVAAGPREIAEVMLRAQARAATWSLYTIAATVLLVAAASFAVLIVGPTAASILLAQLLALALVSSVGLLLIRPHIGARPPRRLEMQRLLRLGVPSSASVLLDWITQYVDRFILLAFVSASDIGIYSFGSRMSQVVQQVGGAAAQAAWDPYSYRRHRRPDSPQLLGRSSTLLLAAVLALCVAVGSGAAALIIAIEGKPEYVVGAAFAFPIGIAYWLRTSRNILLTPLALRFRPEIATLALLVAAVTNVGLDLLLIPQEGIYGAAIAALVSAAAGALAGLMLGLSSALITFEPRKLALALVAAVTAYLISSAVLTTNAIVTLALRVAVAAIVYVTALLASRVVPVPASVATHPILAAIRQRL